MFSKYGYYSNANYLKYTIGLVILIPFTIAIIILALIAGCIEIILGVLNYILFGNKITFYCFEDIINNLKELWEPIL